MCAPRFGSSTTRSSTVPTAGPRDLRAACPPGAPARGRRDRRLLVTRTLPKWAELRRDLQGFVDKHDYRNRRPFTEAESTAYLRALEVLTGAPGLFANDLRAGARAVRGTPRSDISAARPPERGAEDADFDRGKLELRIAELTEQVERSRTELYAARSAAGR